MRVVSSHSWQENKQMYFIIYFNWNLKSPKSSISKNLSAVTLPVSVSLFLLCLSFLFLLCTSLPLSPTSPLILSRPPSLPTTLSQLSLSLSLSRCWLCPSLCSSTHFFHGFFGCLFPLSSLLLLKPRDAAHLTAEAVSRARLSPCVAATTAVNLVQTRCLFYFLTLSRGRKKGVSQMRKQKTFWVCFVFFDGSPSSIQPK